MADQDEELRHALRELQSLEGASLRDALQHAVDSAAAVLTVNGSGVMFADGEHILRYVTASDGHGRELEHVQEQTGTGPCVEALIHGVVIATDDVSADARWPALHDALRQTRVRAVLGVPIHVGGAVAGSIDAYRDRRHEWRQAEIDGLVAYAALVERFLLNALRTERDERTIKQLEHALQHRITIERAVGVLMERERLDSVAAFERLRSAARDSRRRAAEIADEILASVAPSRG